MEKKNENPKIEELTDEQMKNVVGGRLSPQECAQERAKCEAKSDCGEQINCLNNLEQQYGCLVSVGACGHGTTAN